MNNSIFVIAIAIASVYLIFRFIEMRMIVKENKPLKVLFRDTLLVYLSVLLGSFIIDQISPLKDTLITSPEVFTNDPAF